MTEVPADPQVAGAAPADVLDTPEAGRRVVRGGALRVGGFIGGLGASLIGAALVTRHLGPVNYGRYQTVVALVTIVQAVTDLGMSTLGLREYAQRSGEDRERFMRVLLGMRLALTTVGVGVAMLAAVVLGYDHEMVIGAGLMGFGLIFLTIAGTVGIPLSAELRMGAVTGLDVGRQVGLAALFVLLVVLGAGVPAFLAATIPVHFLMLVATLVLVGWAVPVPMFDRRQWLALVRPTITFALATAVGSLYVYTALVLTSLVASQEQTGLFAASFRVYAIAAAIPGVLVTTAFPLLSRAARDDRARLRYATQRLFEGTALLGGGALIACVLGAGPIIAVVAGPKFAGAADVLRIQGTALALTFVISTWGFTLLAMHRHREMIRANGIALVVSATTVLVLASTHGAVGAAFGTLLGELTLSIGYVWGIAGGDPHMRPRTRRVRRLVPAVALGLAAGLLPLPAVVTAALGVAIYGVAALLLGGVPQEIREHLPGQLAHLGPADVADEGSPAGPSDPPRG
jgi:O-antigen/teichoic acid export membrane protein